MNYYDEIANGYDELHSEEQLKKLEIIKQHFQPQKTDKLLDVGCGTGVSSLWDCKVYGVDSSEKLLEQFRDKVKDKKNYFILQADAESLPFSDEEFDYVISLTAIQNFDDIKKGIEEIRRVGKNNFALTFLKKSPKREEIIDIIKGIFYDFELKQIEEEKDIILVLKKSCFN